MTDNQIDLPTIFNQVPELPSVMVMNLWGGPTHRMFLRKHLELLPWKLNS